MKLFFDFFPIVLFFITFKLYEDPQEGILAATGVIIAATAVQVLATWLRRRRVEKLHLITLVLVVVFGGFTLILEDQIFIKWKPTVVDWLFALAFLASQYIGKRSIVRRLMEEKIELPVEGWTRLNFSWIGFFLLMGCLNLYVVYNFDTDTWVNFKLFGLMGLTVAFLIGQGFYLARHIKPENES